MYYKLQVNLCKNPQENSIQKVTEMEMTPLQSWFLLYGESIPSPEQARETFQEVYVGKMNETKERAINLLLIKDSDGMDALADHLEEMVNDAINAVSQEITAGNSLPIDEVIEQTAQYLAARIIAEHE